jgi:hypothetical protein
MIQNVLHHIGGIGLYGIISICLFFTVFLGVVAWAALLKKPYLKSMSALPLDGGETGPATPSENSPQPESPHE